MARFTATALVVLAISAISVSASDPELTTDFFAPIGTTLSMINGSYFTFSKLEGGVSPAPAPGKFGVTKVFSNAFPALAGLGISAALLEFTPKCLNPPHTHPRGTELLYVITGRLNVGLIDTNNKQYEKNITADDLFVFPEGLVHYQINLDQWNNATAVASFSSSSPGLVLVGPTVFGSGIPSIFLSEAFGVKGDVVRKLEKEFRAAKLARV